MIGLHLCVRTFLNLLITAMLLGACSNYGTQSTAQMNSKILDELLKSELPQAEGKPGFWTARQADLTLYVMSDEHHDRMRIMTPVKKVEDADPRMLKTLLSANFNKTMDARYAISGNMIYSTYVHPLQSLTKDEFIAALDQVATLARNTGTSYAAGDLIFGKQEDRSSR